MSTHSDHVNIIDSAQMEWINGLDVLPTMPPAFRDNLGPVEDLATMLTNYDVKPLLFEAETTRRIDLVHLRPGYIDLTDAYHESVEECFVLDGEVTAEESCRTGDYFWRPPGWVHSAHSRDGFLALLMMEGVSPDDSSGFATRVIRPSEEQGTNPLVADPDGAIGPRGWVRHLRSSMVPWQSGDDFFRSEGTTDGVSLDALRVKVLSKNHHTGAQSLLVSLSPGFSQARSVQPDTQYTYVISGSLSIDGTDVGPGGFFVRPGGEPFPAIESSEGAELFVKHNGWWQVTPS